MSRLFCVGGVAAPGTVVISALLASFACQVKPLALLVIAPILLFYVIGLMEDQIANQMGMTADAVGQLRRRGLGTVRKVAVG